MNRRKVGLAAYLLLTFGITWGIEIGLLRGMEYGAPAYVIALVGVMFVPALAALVVRLWVEREGFADAGLRWGRGRFYLWAWLLPVALGAVAMALSVALRQAEFDPWMTEMMVRIRLRAPDLKLPPFHMLRIYIIAGSLTQAVLINSIPCFGEEFGWRGYLLMRLLLLGRGRALLLSGLIWGVWHAPIILQGHNYPEHPQLGALLMVGFCVCLSFILGWLRLASGSVLTAAVAHASINGPAMLPLAFVRDRNDITAGLTGLIGQGIMVVFVIVLWRSGALRASHIHTPQGETDAEERLPESGGQSRGVSVYE